MPFPLSLCSEHEAVSILLQRAKTGGFISGCTLKEQGGNNLRIFHLLFMDDTIVFCEVLENQLFYLSWVFLWFETSLG